MTPEEAHAKLTSTGEVAFDQLIRQAKDRGNEKFFYYGETDEWLTFREFAQQSVSLGLALIEMGVAKGDRVCVYGSNSKTCALSMFGIWAAGGVYAPINFNLKGALLEHQLVTVNPKVVIADVVLVDRVVEFSSKLDISDYVVFGLDDLISPEVELGVAFHRFSDLVLGTSYEPPVSLNYDDFAAIIFTSGTTGPAKGVLQRFRYVCQYTRSRGVLTIDDVCYCDLPMYHVGGAFALVVRACWAGAKVVVWDRFSASEFWNRIERSGASAAILLDVMLPWLMKRDPARTDRENSLNKVHMQPLPENHNEIARRFGIDFVFTGYGSTEIGSVFGCMIDELAGQGGTPSHLYKGKSRNRMFSEGWPYCDTVLSGSELRPRGVIGRPSPLFDVAIHDSDGLPVAKGTTGQMAVRSKYPAMTFHSYYGNPDATLDAVHNYWFNSGDDCYEGDNGLFYFVGRRGGHFRVRGENVSAYEVESSFCKHQSIELAACIPLKAVEGDEEEIVLFVQLVSSQKLTGAEVIEWGRSELPGYMIPSRIVFVDEIPVTPTNKIEKYKLTEML